MRRILLATLVLAVGCGRFGFDDSGDAGTGVEDGGGTDSLVCVPVGHDEDGDGVDDACDVCPHLAGTQADQDGDRVGDACDPEPTLASQRIVVFDPFETLEPVWDVHQASVLNGQLRLDGTTGGLPILKRPYQRADDLFIIAGSIGGAAPATLRIFGLIMVDGLGGRYYCEFFDNTVMSQLSFTYTVDGSNFTSEGTKMPMAQVVGGAGRFSMRLAGSAATCTSTWRGEVLEAPGTVPAVTPNELWIYSENFDATIDYFVQIRTEP